MSNFLDDQLMVLIATEQHEGSGRPTQTWVNKIDADILLSGTAEFSDLHPRERLSVGPYLETRTGKKTIWYQKAGPLRLIELEEWADKGFADGPHVPCLDHLPESLRKHCFGEIW